MQYYLNIIHLQIEEKFVKSIIFMRGKQVDLESKCISRLENGHFTLQTRNPHMKIRLLNLQKWFRRMKISDLKLWK